jgi:putative spermidine/putrescine transport system substrate-binding protein
MRRSSRLWLLLAFAALPLRAETTLEIATWGGPYERAQRESLFEPFRARSGIDVRTRSYQGGLEILRTPDPPDLVDMTMAEARHACADGLIRAFALRLEPAPDGSPAEDDFAPGALTRCGVAHLNYSTLVAFDERAFPGEKPSTIDDFFDLERFPGKRSLPASPDAVLEWALMAEGVPVRQVYDLLSTQRGIRLALRRLERLRGHLVWSQGAEQPAEWLESGEVVMAAGFNGRFFDALTRGVPLSMIWDGQIIDRDVWVIPASIDGTRLEAAREFIRFATATERQAALAELIPYGPTRRSALAYIGLHPRLGIPMLAQLPNAPHHLGRALLRDARWYARTENWRRREFEQWRQRNAQNPAADTLDVNL